MIFTETIELRWLVENAGMLCHLVKARAASVRMDGYGGWLLTISPST